MVIHSAKDIILIFCGDERQDIMNDRKNEIIKATLELAAENGLGTVSMQQIANKVGITKASLYNHFSSRDEIVEEMYVVLRDISKKKAVVGGIDYDKLGPEVSLKDILMGAVSSYHSMVNDPDMFLFYKVIMSERTINNVAAEIMARETQTMINATKSLFFFFLLKKIAHFDDPDAAAFSFAMTVHAILDYESDLKFAGLDNKSAMMSGFIEEFCRIYGNNEKEKKDEQRK